VSGTRNLASCSNRLRFQLADGKPQPAVLNWLRTNNAACPNAQRAPIPFAPGTVNGGGSTKAPTGLRVRLTCAANSAGGSCSAFLRLRVQFKANVLSQSINVLEDALRKIETDDGWRVETRSWVDTLGICGVSDCGGEELGGHLGHLWGE
jgi:hypothetical protein